MDVEVTQQGGNTRTYTFGEPITKQQEQQFQWLSKSRLITSYEVMGDSLTITKTPDEDWEQLDKLVIPELSRMFGGKLNIKVHAHH